jgi:hypothetical protein
MDTLALDIIDSTALEAASPNSLFRFTYVSTTYEGCPDVNGVVHVEGMCLAGNTLFTINVTGILNRVCPAAAHSFRAFSLNRLFVHPQRSQRRPYA